MNAELRSQNAEVYPRDKRSSQEAERDLKVRTKHFAIRIIHLYKSLPHSEEARVVGRQFLRSGTSVGANYRAACRARSRAEFIAKLGIVLEEADETHLWLEVCDDRR